MDCEILDEVKTLRGLLIYVAVYYNDGDGVEEYINRFERGGFINIGWNIGNKVRTVEAEYKTEYSKKYQYQSIVDVLVRRE